MILAKAEWWNKVKGEDGAPHISWSEHPWLWPGHSTHWCQQDTVGTTSCWREDVLKSLYSEGDTWNWEKTSLTFPVILEDEKVWTVESGQLLSQRCSEITVERSISSNPNWDKQRKRAVEWFNTKAEEVWYQLLAEPCHGQGVTANTDITGPCREEWNCRIPLQTQHWLLPRKSGSGGSLHLVPREQENVTGACIHHRSWEALPRPVIKKLFQFSCLKIQVSRERESKYHCGMMDNGQGLAPDWTENLC